jgi:hypothetical protein
VTFITADDVAADNHITLCVEIDTAAGIIRGWLLR